MQEVWKPIVGYEGIYEVSNFGNVRSFKCKNVKIFKLSYNKLNYVTVTLHLNGKQKTRAVHQLVAEAFLGHTPCGHELVIDHINDNKSDNRLENLQIVTTRFNCRKTQGKYTSQYKGVHFSKYMNKWHSSIRINNKKVHLGYFSKEEEARDAYISKLNQIKTK